MQTKIINDRPTLFGGKEKIWAIAPLPNAGYGTALYDSIYNYALISWLKKFDFYGLLVALKFFSYGLLLV